MSGLRVLRPGATIALNFRQRVWADVALLPLGKVVRAVFAVPRLGAWLSRHRSVTRVEWQVNRLDPHHVLEPIRDRVCDVVIWRNPRRAAPIWGAGGAQLRYFESINPAHWWLVATRRWTLIAWGFLTAGIVLGAWWSYEVLGWGGYWAWDPVENASLLPWLTGTAYLHSVMVQERRGMLRVWNLSLLCATFSLTILGTFITRSGVLDSVHAFTESAIGPSILTFFGLTVLVTVGLLLVSGSFTLLAGYFSRMTPTFILERI